MRLAALFALTLIVPALAAATDRHVKSPEDAQFRRWLINYLKHDASDADNTDLNNLEFGYSLVDLNADGRNEAVVYLSNADYCGSSGCWLQVFKRTKAGWKPFADAGNTRPPIKLLPTKTHGWRDLSGWQYGGGTYRPFRSWFVPSQQLPRLRGAGRANDIEIRMR